MKNILRLTVILGLISGLYSCSKVTTDKDNKNTSYKDNQVTMKTETGSEVLNVGNKAVVPTGFPKDIYIPDNAKITASLDNNEKSYIAGEVTNDVSSTISTISKNMPERGFKADTGMKTENATVLAFVKDKLFVTYMISPEAGHTRFNITIRKH